MCDGTGADERNKKLPHVLSSRCFLPQHTYICNKSKQITATERQTAAWYVKQDDTQKRQGGSRREAVLSYLTPGTEEVHAGRLSCSLVGY